MKKLLSHKGIWILAAALSLSLIVAVLSLFSIGRTGPLAALGQSIARPFHTIASTVSDNVSHLYGQAAQYEQLRLENESLRAQLAKAEESARDGKLSTEENQRLRSLLDFKQRRRDLSFEPAKVVSTGATNWSRSLTLSKGSSSGIAARDCVVDSSGRLLGVVSEVSDHSATVYLITDAGFELGGEGVPSLERGVLCGDFALMQGGKLKLSYLPRETALKEGDEVVSIATEGLYPSGLPVGTVSSIERDPGGLYAYALITPSASLENLHQVFVITDFQIED